MICPDENEKHGQLHAKSWLYHRDKYGGVTEVMMMSLGDQNKQD